MNIKKPSKKSKEQLDVPMEAALPCKEGTKKHSEFQETGAKSDEFNKIRKTKHTCIVEAHESTRKHLDSPLPKIHEDHNSMSHCNLVHKFIPMAQGMKIRDAKAAVDREWKKLETTPAWQLDKMKSKKVVILEAQRDKNKVHFSTLMDVQDALCVRLVRPSPVILSPLANVFVNLSSVMVFCIVKL